MTHLNPYKLRNRKGNPEFHAQRGQEQQRRRRKMVTPRLPWLRQEKSQHHHSRLQPCLLTRWFLIFIGRRHRRCSTPVHRGCCRGRGGAEVPPGGAEVEKYGYQTGVEVVEDWPDGTWCVAFAEQLSPPQPEQVFQLTLQVTVGMEKLREGCAGS